MNPEPAADDWVVPGAAPAPVAQAAAPADDWVVPGAAPAAPVPGAMPSLATRFGQNALEGLHGGSTGALMTLSANDMLPGQGPGILNKILGMVQPPSIQAAIAGRNTARAIEDMRDKPLPVDQAGPPNPEMAPWNTNKGLGGDSILQGGAALAGQLIGGMGNPENLISAGAARAREAGEGAVNYLGHLFGQGAKTVAPAAALGNAASQAADIATGQQESFSPVDMAVASGLGALIGGGLHVAPELARSLVERVRAGRAPNVDPAAPVTPQEAAGVIMPEDLANVAKANGITNPTDPRLAPLQAILEGRRNTEAQVAGMAPASADRTVLRGQQDAIEGGADPAAVAVPQRETPATIQVGPSGAAVPLDAEGRMTDGARSINEGVKLRNGTNNTALVPLEPQPNRMTPDEIAAAQRINERSPLGNPNTAPDPGRGNALVTPPDRAPQLPAQTVEQTGAGDAFRIAQKQADRGPVRAPGDLPGGDLPPDARSQANPLSRVLRPDDAKVEAVPPGTHDLPPVMEIDPARAARAPEPPAEAPPPPAPRHPFLGPMEPREASPAATPRPEPELPEWMRGGRRPESGPIVHPIADSAPPAPRPAEPARPVEAPKVEAPKAEPFKLETPAAPEPAKPAADNWQATRDEARGKIANGEADLARLRSQKVQAQAALDAYLAGRPHLNTEPKVRAAARDDGKLAQLRADVNNAQRGITVKQQAVEASKGRAAVADRMLEQASQGQEPTVRPKYGDPELDKGVALGTPPAPPERISEAVRRLGGIKDVGGDLRSMDLQRRPGIINNKAGIGADEMARKLAEEGFLHDASGKGPEGDLAGQLRDALGQDHNQAPVYRPEEAAMHDQAMQEHEVHEENIQRIADHIGVTREQLRGLSVGQLADITAEHMSFEEAVRREGNVEAHADEEMPHLENLISLTEEEHAALHDNERAGESQPATLEDHHNAVDSEHPSGPSRESGRAGEPGADGERQPGSEEPGGERGAAGEGEGGSAGRPGEEVGSGANGDEPRLADSERQGDGEPAGQHTDAESPVQGAEREPVTGKRFEQHELGGGTEATQGQAVRAGENAPNRGSVPQADMSKFDLFDPHARDQGGLPLVNDTAKAVDSGFRNKLYSGGAIFDPDAWKFMFGPLKKGIVEPFVKSWKEFQDAFSTSSRAAAGKDNRVPRAPFSDKGAPLAARLDNALPRPARAVTALVRTALYGSDSAMRAIADRLPAGAREAGHEFLDKFFARAGEGREAGRTYDSGVDMRTNKVLGDLGKILGKSAESKDEMAQIARLVQNPGSIRPGSRLHDAAAGVQGWLKEHLDYMKKAGMDVGEIRKGYFPRRLDSEAVWKDSDGFRTAAEQAYRAAGLSAADAKMEAGAWLDHVKRNGADAANPLAAPNTGMSADHVKGRALPKSADEILSKYLQKDPLQVLAGYATGAAKRAEYMRVMGKNNEAWTGLMDKLRKAGAEGVAPRFQGYVREMTGTNRTDTNGGLMAAGGWLRAMGSIGMMSHSTITSLSEIFAMGSRTGNILDNFTAAKLAAADAFRKGGTDIQRVRALAEDIGTITNHLGNSFAAARWTGGDPTSALQGKVLEKYFRRVGLEQWSHGQRVAGTGVADVFLRRTAHNMADAESGTARRARFSMAELGVPAAKQEALATWLRANADGGMTVDKLRAAPADVADAYRTAVHRFADQTHMRASKATRPGWANTPLGSVAFHLSNYSYATHTNVVMRAARMMQSGDLTAADKMILAGKTIMGLSLAIPAQMAIGEARSALLDTPQQRKNYPDHATETAVSRSGVLGAIDPLYQMYAGVRYHRDLATSMAGPTLGRLASAAQTAINYNQGSTHTDSQTRQMVQALYDAGLQPAANFALTGIPMPLAAAVTQWIGANSTKEKFVSNFAGPAKMTDNRFAKRK